MRRSVVFMVAMLVAGCGAGDDGAEPAASGGVVESIDLPKPEVAGGAPLADTLAGRRSIREYRQVPVELADISQLLWATQGITSEFGQRTAPSVGGLYPLEIYLVTPDGRYHYIPDDHQLAIMGDEDVRGELSEAALSQEAVAQAGAVFVIAAVYTRTAGKYGTRAERYVKLEAGHAAEGTELEIPILGTRRKATVIADSPYDPGNQRPRM